LSEERKGGGQVKKKKGNKRRGGNAASLVRDSRPWSTRLTKKIKEIGKGFRLG